MMEEESSERMFRIILLSNQKRISLQAVLCLQTYYTRNEKNGIVYHREGINGDYDDFDDVEALIEYIKTGHR